MKNYLKILKINEQVIIPKYRQLADSIIVGIEEGTIQKNDILPSLHELSTALDISKNTVEKAYNSLKIKGVVNSFKGKGYFIESELHFKNENFNS